MRGTPDNPSKCTLPSEATCLHFYTQNFTPNLILPKKDILTKNATKTCTHSEGNGTPSIMHFHNCFRFSSLHDLSASLWCAMAWQRPRGLGCKGTNEPAKSTSWGPSVSVERQIVSLPTTVIGIDMVAGEVENEPYLEFLKRAKEYQVPVWVVLFGVAGGGIQHSPPPGKAGIFYIKK